MPPNKPRIIAILPGFIPSTLMHIVKPMLGLQAAGLIQFQTVLELHLDPNIIRDADLVIFCRNTEPRHRRFLDYVLQNKIPFIYDIDDNLFEAPSTSKSTRHHSSPEHLACLSYYVSSADFVRAYSKPLTERVKTLNPRGQEVLPTLDWSLIQSPSRNPGDSGTKLHPIKIIYATSRQDDYLYPIFSDALLRVLREYPDQVTVYFWGFNPPEFKDHHNVHCLPMVPNYNAYLRQFSSLGFDIGLAPMLDDSFHRAKTNTKFREYGACGIAGIYSLAQIYTNCVEDGKTGLLVTNETESWYAALVKLIQDDALRYQIGQAAKAQVRQTYSQEHFQNVWWEQIQWVLTNPQDKPVPPPPPILAVRKSAELRNPRLRLWITLVERISRAANRLVSDPKRFWATIVWHIQNLSWTIENWWTVTKIRWWILKNLWWQFKINNLHRV